MRIHADFSRRVTLAADEMPWVPSPQAPCSRRMPILALSGTFEEGGWGRGAGEAAHLLHPAGSYPARWAMAWAWLPQTRVRWCT